MKRIVIDLTEFNQWSGHLTGVQRVVYGIAKGFQEKGAHDTQLSFVKFDGRQAFHEVSYEQFSAAITPQEEVLSLVASSARTSDVKKRVKTVVKKVYYRTPLFVRNYFTPVRQEKLVRKARGLYAKAKNLRAPKRADILVKSANTFNFNKGDVVISAGRAWDDDKYINALELLKHGTGIELAYVMYDLVPIYQQHTFGPGLTERYSRYLYRTLKNGDYLFPISKSTKRDLLKFADDIGVIHLPEIKTIRLGDEIPGVPATTAPVFVKDPSSFTISVGTIEARKNHIELYYAYKLAAEKGIVLPDLYIIGKPGWLTGDIIYFIEHDLEVNQKIKIVYNVSDQELAWLYEHALFTVYPSQYEGWGLPIAESIAYGTPCIASHASSMIEIAPTYVNHVSPFDTGELLEQMVNLSNPKNSHQKRQEIEAGYKLYTWDKVAQDLQKAITN